MDLHSFCWLLWIILAIFGHVTGRANHNSDEVDKQNNDVRLDDSLAHSQNEHHKAKRNVRLDFTVYPTSKWSFPINYKIDSTHINASEAVILESALLEWSAKTCVTFNRLADSATPTGQYVLFTDNNSQCRSLVGQRTDVTPPQQVQLQDSCFSLRGYILHTIGHLLGLYHTNDRSDRDSYVDVFLSNVDASQVNTFNVITTGVTSHGTPYDYGSVMHFTSTENTVNQQPTILPKDRKYTSVIGQRSHLSFYDVKIVNEAYCAGICTTSLTCANDGYPNPNNCTQCLCPEEWSGPDCSTVPTGSAKCFPLSGSRTHTSADIGNEKVLFSPEYWNKPFTPGDKCFWQLKGPVNTRFRLWFSNAFDPIRFAFGLYKDGTHCMFWVELKNPGETTGERVCGSQAVPPTTQYYSTTNEIYVIFLSFSDVLSEPITPNNNIIRGFELHYILEDVPVTTSSVTSFVSTSTSAAPTTTSASETTTSATETTTSATETTTSATETTTSATETTTSATETTTSATTDTTSNSETTTLTSETMPSTAPGTTSALATTTSTLATTTSNATTSAVATSNSTIATTTSSAPVTTSTIATTTSSAPVTTSTIATTTSSEPVTTSTIATTTSSAPVTTSTIATTSSSAPVTTSTIATTTSSVPITTSTIATAASSIATTTSNTPATTSTEPITSSTIPPETSTSQTTSSPLLTTTTTIATTTSAIATNNSTETGIVASSSTPTTSTTKATSTSTQSQSTTIANIVTSTMQTTSSTKAAATSDITTTTSAEKSTTSTTSASTTSVVPSTITSKSSSTLPLTTSDGASSNVPQTTSAILYPSSTATSVATTKPITSSMSPVTTGLPSKIVTTTYSAPFTSSTASKVTSNSQHQTSSTATESSRSAKLSSGSLQETSSASVTTSNSRKISNLYPLLSDLNIQSTPIVITTSGIKNEVTSQKSINKTTVLSSAISTVKTNTYSSSITAKETSTTSLSTSDLEDTKASSAMVTAIKDTTVSSKSSFVPAVTTRVTFVTSTSSPQASTEVKTSALSNPAEPSTPGNEDTVSIEDTTEDTSKTIQTTSSQPADKLVSNSSSVSDYSNSSVSMTTSLVTNDITGNSSNATTVEMDDGFLYALTLSLVIAFSALSTCCCIVFVIKRRDRQKKRKRQYSEYVYNNSSYLLNTSDRTTNITVLTYVTDR